MMITRTLFASAAVAAALFAWRGDFVAAQQQQSVPAPAGQQSQLPEPQVLEKGPIHEAYADPLTLDRQPTEILTKQPPEPVQELPPSEQPEGQNVQWIPGYWMWDQGVGDFVWVSGMWRDVPPGREWVPGEWQQVDGGWQWVPGFWADAQKEQIALLPEPPASLEQGPSSPAPGENYLWAPGNWYWQNGQYVWQPGYWYEANPNWVWVPNHYSYTPRGYIFVNGYWDYLPYNRGLLFAPVYWGRSYGYGYGYYRPRSVINTALLIANLAVNRGWGHYYYGNWGGNYPGWLHPWGYNYGPWGYRSGGYFGYDPLWSYFRWSNRNRWDDDWWKNRNNWNRDWDDWNRWSWDGRRRGDWDRDWDRDRDGRPGDRDGRPGDRGPRDRDRDRDIADRDRDGRPGDRGPRDRDIADRDRDGRGRQNLVTSIDDLARSSGRDLRTRQLSQADIDRIRNRSQEFRSRRENIVSDSNIGRNLEGQIRGDRDLRGRGRLDGQARVGADGQARQGRGRGQLGADAEAQVGDALRGRVGADGQVQRQGQGRGRGQLGIDADARARDTIQGRVDADARNQFRRGQGGRGTLEGRVQSEAGRVDQSADELLRNRGNQNRTIEPRSYTRGPQGGQFSGRPQGRGPGNVVPRNLEGRVQQRVMRPPTGQQGTPGQSFRSRVESGPSPRSFSPGQSGRSFNVPSQGSGRSIQRAPERATRSIPNVGGGQSMRRGGGEAFRGGGGGRGGSPAMRSGGGGRGGGSAFRGGGGGGGRGGGEARGGGRGRGGRD